MSMPGIKKDRSSTTIACLPVRSTGVCSWVTSPRIRTCDGPDPACCRWLVAKPAEKELLSPPPSSSFLLLPRLSPPAASTSHSCPSSSTSPPLLPPCYPRFFHFAPPPLPFPSSSSSSSSSSLLLPATPPCSLAAEGSMESLASTAHAPISSE
eukprot:761812-Hanusia_phi.AAC.6